MITPQGVRDLSTAYHAMTVPARKRFWGVAIALSQTDTEEFVRFVETFVEESIKLGHLAFDETGEIVKATP